MLILAFLLKCISCVKIRYTIAIIIMFVHNWAVAGGFLWGVGATRWPSNRREARILLRPSAQVVLGFQHAKEGPKDGTI